MTNYFTRIGLFVFLGLMLASQGGCEDDKSASDGEGSLTVSLWGEEYIEQGIPLSDGYQVVFDKFLISLNDVSAAKSGSAPAITFPEQKVWDLTVPGPVTIGSGIAPAGAYDHATYRIAPASGAVAGNALPEDVSLMNTEGYAVYAKGHATDNTNDISFAWGFATDTLYDPCHSIASLKSDGAASVQITIHGDHLFYADAVSADPATGFADIALADADGNGDVTKDELLNYDIRPLPNYGVGNLDIENLFDFISYMTSTLGHIDGEHHCE